MAGELCAPGTPTDVELGFDKIKMGLIRRAKEHNAMAVVRNIHGKEKSVYQKNVRDETKRSGGDEQGECAQLGLSIHFLPSPSLGTSSHIHIHTKDQTILWLLC